jgi:WD40 repeat protein
MWSIRCRKPRKPPPSSAGGTAGKSQSKEVIALALWTIAAVSIAGTLIYCTISYFSVKPTVLSTPVGIPSPSIGATPIVTFPHAGPVESAVFSQDGRRVLIVSKTEVKASAWLWEAERGKLLAIFGPYALFNSAVFSPDSRRVLTASIGAIAQLWEAESGKLLVTFQGHTDLVNSAVFSPDGHRVLTASEDGTARLWEAESGKLLVTFQGHTDVVRSAVFSPDGHRVLTASGDKTARLWEAESGKALATFQVRTDSSPLDLKVFRTDFPGVESAVFSPDGRRVLTASRDGTARLWEAPP